MFKCTHYTQRFPNVLITIYIQRDLTKIKALTNKSSFIFSNHKIIIHILVSNNLYFAQTLSILSYT